MNLDTAAPIITAHLHRLRTGPDSIGGEPPEHAAIAYILGLAHKAAIYERDYRAGLKREAELRRLLERCAIELDDCCPDLAKEIRGDMPPKSQPLAVLECDGQDWPLDDPNQVVTVCHGLRPSEGASVRTLKSGEMVEAIIGGQRVRGVVRR